jgi:hypothetical protein
MSAISAFIYGQSAWGAEQDAQENGLAARERDEGLGRAMP